MDMNVCDKAIFPAFAQLDWAKENQEKSIRTASLHTISNTEPSKHTEVQGTQMHLAGGG